MTIPLIATIGFALFGCGLPMQATADQVVPSVSTCELAADPQKYDNTIVRLHCGYFVWWEGSYLYDLSCNSADFYISPEFSQTTSEACRPAQSIEKSLRPDAKDLAKRAEVTVLGRFHNDDDRAFSPDQLRFSFEVLCVEQATAIPGSTPWPSERPMPAPVIDGRRAILKTTTDWMAAFIDGKVGPGRVFSRDYRLTTPDGRTLTRDEAVASLIDRQALGEVSFPFESMLIRGDAAIVRGRIIITTGTPSTGKTTIYAYTNGYFKDHGVWRVVTTHLSLLK